MKKIVISGITGFKNRGVDALVTTVVEGIHTVNKSNAPITVLTDTPQYDTESGKHLKVNFVSDTFRNRKARYIRKLGGKPLANALIPLVVPSFRKTVDLVEGADVVIASGGDVFSSDYGDLGEFLVSLEAAQRAGKKVVFIGHSIGPFKTKEEEEAWTRVANQSELITLRESFSYDYVVNKLKVPSSKVHLTADSAFNLRIPDSNCLSELARLYGIDRDRPTIALSISQGIKKFAKVAHDGHLNAWTKLVRTATERLGLQVVIVSHVQDQWELNDDRLASQEVASQFSGNPLIRVVNGDHTASELKGIIQMADMVVAERMHAAIAGLSSGIATAVIGYSVKAQGILFDLLQDNVEKYRLLVSVQDFVNKIDAGAWVEQLWNRRCEVGEHLAQSLPQVKNRANQNFELLAKIL
ncbi:polysaccharide pyruvyl transferase family protein [Cohnella fermenti]|uniref:Polysaccharide pyruvyl transferase family protein n=1 Tax=Cohnella fermenti TaxID=2565925 RepID=A0A4S4BKP2_9BACL|nr:polysaccharide pyruvyl transferase family protein [Cohnella fermenti]THF74696.1 polysaccharide pyruvyl transferase family protein [Cohnella fermenti]